MKPYGEHARHVNHQVKATKLVEAVGKLECNPNGQFAWFPEPVTSRIVSTLADQLQYGGRDGR